MTTNHIEQLDAALIRPGRVDQRYFLGNATASQARDMFLRFYDGQHFTADIFVDNLTALGLVGQVSPAQLQGHFVMHRQNAESAATLLEGLVPQSGDQPKQNMAVHA